MIAPEAAAEAWRKALAFWGLAIQIAPPRFDEASSAIAFIDLVTREITVNPKRVAALRAEDCLYALFAHELGHHLRYPHSLAIQARLELLQVELFGVRRGPLLNLFTDFLINVELAAGDPDLRSQLVRIYQGLKLEPEMVRADPPFFFFLTCFEEAWKLAPHTLTRELGAELEELFPGCRAEAQRVVEDLPNLAPNVFTQFLYFASVMSRYQLVDPEKPSAAGETSPMAGDHSRPSAGDYADALERGAQEKTAIERAIREDWLDRDRVPDAEASRRARIAAMPGVLSGEPQKLSEAMALHYRRLAERYLMQPPKEPLRGEPTVPTTLSPWEVGDSPREIDWLASFSARGPELGAVAPLKRDWEEDEPNDAERPAAVDLEIYLDVSGSMPDPKGAINSMTLAAQVLSMSAIRGGGRVRALIYSTNHVAHWQWTRSEVEMSTFLMMYIGGGTAFPFEVLQRSVRECGSRQPIRVVLTDFDFLHNFECDDAHPRICREAAASLFIALLNVPLGYDTSALRAADIEVIPVPDVQYFPAVTAALGKRLFGANRRSA